MNTQIVVLILFIVTFALILYRRIPIRWISLGSAAILMVAGIVPPLEAVTESISWSVLAIYFGYGMLATAMRESRVPAAVAGWILPKVRRERYALLFLCTLAAVLSSFMANPVVVLMLAPLAIEMAERLRSSLFIYLVGLAIASNAVTTVSMVADPTALFVISVAALAVPPTNRFPALVGLVLGLVSLFLIRGKAREALREFDWDSILFLIGIFVLVHAVDRVGLLERFAAWLPGIGLTGPILVMTVITWMSVLLSAFIDNVPYTILMIPTCTYLARSLGIDPFALYFGMLVGTGIGGNITPVGATANVIACGILERRGHRIDLGSFMKLSIPFSVSAVLVTQLLLIWIWL